MYLRICPKCNNAFYLAVDIDLIVCKNCEYSMYGGQSKEGVKPKKVHLFPKGEEKKQYARGTHLGRTKLNH